MNNFIESELRKIFKKNKGYLRIEFYLKFGENYVLGKVYILRR